MESKNTTDEMRVRMFARRGRGRSLNLSSWSLERLLGSRFIVSCPLPRSSDRLRADPVTLAICRNRSTYRIKLHSRSTSLPRWRCDSHSFSQSWSRVSQTLLFVAACILLNPAYFLQNEHLNARHVFARLEDQPRRKRCRRRIDPSADLRARA